MQLFFLEQKKWGGVMHDEYDSPNYREETFGPLWGAYDNDEWKSPNSNDGLFSLVLVKVSVCV